MRTPKPLALTMIVLFVPLSAAPSKAPPARAPTPAFDVGLFFQKADIRGKREVEFVVKVVNPTGAPVDVRYEPRRAYRSDMKASRLAEEWFLQLIVQVDDTAPMPDVPDKRISASARVGPGESGLMLLTPPATQLPGHYMKVWSELTGPGGLTYASNKVTLVRNDQSPPEE
jgi:hypothetical protein